MTLSSPAPVPLRRPAARRDLALPTLWTVYDWATAFLAILASTDVLARFGLNSIVWLGVYGLVLLRLATVYEAAYRLVVQNLAYFAYPAACLASVLWSVSAKDSLVAAVQLTVTVLVATFIGARFSLRAICLLHLAATFIGCFLSLVNWATGVFGPIYAPAGGLLGVFTQKNQLGQRAMFAVLSGVALLLQPSRDPLLKLVVAGALGVALFMLALSLSVTSILLLPTSVGLLMLLCAHRFPSTLVLAGAIAAVVLVALGPIGLALVGVDPVATLFAAFGKSSTLTGRTDIWAMAEDVIGRYPILGVGFSAFWESPRFANYAYLAQEIGGEGVAGFHNFILEIWAGTGVFGLAGIATMLVVTFCRIVALYRRTRSVMAAYAFAGTFGAIGLSLFFPNFYRQHEYLMMFVVMVGVAAQAELGRHARRGAS